MSEHIPCTDVVHRGRPGSFDHSSAYGQWGRVMVELVMQHDDEPSAVRDMYAPGETGLHHLAYFVDDLDETAGGSRPRATRRPRSPRPAAAPASPSTTPSPSSATCSSSTSRAPGILGFYAMVADAAEGWDGRDPIRGVTA